MRYNERSFEQFEELYYKRFPKSTIKLIKFEGKLKIIADTKYGKCSFHRKFLLKGANATILSAINKTEYFINQLKEIYNDRFDYTSTQYVNYSTKIKLVCKIHGAFEQRSDHLLNGISCPKCGRDVRKQQLREKSFGWSYSRWEKFGNKSKNFDSFKVYIIKCWDNNEQFYKVGKTFTTVKRRYQSKNEMPYKWKLLKIYTGKALDISNLELKLKNMNKNNKYLPKNFFNGMHECFKIIKTKDEIFSS